MMRRTPVVTIAAIASLALGIGANTAIVSLMDVVLWRNLPVPAPQQLALLHWQGHGFPRELADSAAGSMWDEKGVSVADFFSYPSFEAMRNGLGNSASLAAFTEPEMVSVGFAGKPVIARQRPVTGNFFSTMQVHAELGRVFNTSDDNEAAPASTVVSHRFWVSALNADAAAIGKTLIVNSRPAVIIGVLEPSFYGLIPGDGTEIYAPLHHAAWGEMEGKSALTNNRSWVVQLVARRPAGSDARLLASLTTLFHASWSREPKDGKTAPRLRLDDGGRGLGFLRDEFRSPLLVLCGLVGLLLVIACTNIVNLLLARATARRREVEVRAALGCSRARLIRQFVTESALLALLGGAASVGVAYSAANLLGKYLTGRDSLPVAVALDYRILTLAGGITAAAMLLFGLFPAFSGSRISKTNWGRPGAGGLGRAGGHKWTAGRWLVVTQMAMSVLLVLTAVVFTRNLLSIESSDAGFDRRNLVMFGIRPGTSGYENTRLASLYWQVSERLALTPGVAAVGMAAMRPMNVGGWWDAVRLAGDKTAKDASINGITPGYLPLFVGHMTAGRNITRSEVNTQAKVAVISEDLARKFGRGNLLGQTLEFSDGPPGAPLRRFEIVGVAPAIAATSLKERPAAVWLPLELDRPELTIVLRTARRPQLVLPAIRQTMSEVDRNLPLVEVMTMDEQIAKGLQRERMFATLCSGFGILALLLAAVGLYGVIAYSTSRRRSEIGVRLALGARPRDVLSMILREGLGVTVLGMLIALPVAWFGARYVKTLLFEMKPLEPLSIGLALGALSAAALVAVIIPALRAAALQPAETLRQE